MGVDWTFFVLWNECDCPAHSMFRGVNHAKTNFSVTSAYSSQTQPTITARLNFQVTASFRVMLLWSIWPASSLFCRAEQLWQQTMGQIIYRLEMWNVKAQLLECTILVLLCFRWKIRARRALSSVHQVEADGTNIPQVGGKSECPASWMYNSSVVTFQVDIKRWEITEQWQMGQIFYRLEKKVKAQTSSSAVTLQVGIKVKPSFINVKFSWV